MREIVFDTETTGFDPLSGDRMVEIGCVELVNRIPTGATYHAYFNPQRSMPASAEAVHGLSEKFLSAKPLFSQDVDALLDFLGDASLVAHNARFDFGFLNAELRLCGRTEVAETRMVDTLAMARTLHPGAKHGLDALCVRFGIDRSHRIKHGALLDAELLAQVYIELTGGRQIGLGLVTETRVSMASVSLAMEPRLPQRGDASPVRPVRPPRVFTPSAEELARHAAFLDGLDAPLWRGGKAA